jgi:hypothetical protein
MNEYGQTQEEPAPGSLEIAFVLLLLQTAFGAVSTLGTVVIGAAFGALPALGGPILLGLAGPALTILLGVGVGRFRPWARNAAVVYETLLLLGFFARLLIGGSVAFGLVPLLVEFVVPAAALGLLLNRSARGALAAARRPSPLSRLDRRPVTLEPAA